MPRPLGLVTSCLLALLLLAPATPALAHPAAVAPGAVTPAVVDPGNLAGSQPGSSQAVPDRSGEFDPVVPIAPRSEFIEALSPVSAPFAAASALCLVALATLATIARRRRALAVLLVTVLAVLGFEASLHSVHHLGERHELASCTIASASGHLVATETDARVFDPPPSPAVERPRRLSWMAPLLRALDPHESRGPPALVTA